METLMSTEPLPHGMSRCPTCAKPIARGARNCPHCGRTFTTFGGIFLAIVVGVVIGWFVIFRR